MHEKERRSSGTKKGRRRREPAAKDEQTKKEVGERRKAREEQLQKQGKLRVTKERKKRTDSDAQAPTQKRKKRTAGELLAKGKVNQVQKRLQKLGVSTATAAESTAPDVDFLPALKTDFTTEKEFLEEYEHIYKTQSTIIRSLEQRLTEPGSRISSRDIYALSTMYSQMRETMSDMRSIKDMQAQAEALASNVFDPAMKAAGEALVNVFFKLNALLRFHVKDPETVEAVLDKVKQDISVEGSSLQNQLVISREKIMETLSGL
jgi:hypothetical protein